MWWWEKSRAVNSFFCRPVQEGTAGLEEGAGHLYVVVGEIEEQLLHAEQHVCGREKAKLDHLADESTRLPPPPPLRNLVNTINRGYNNKNIKEICP